MAEEIYEAHDSKSSPMILHQQVQLATEPKSNIIGEPLIQNGTHWAQVGMHQMLDATPTLKDVQAARKNDSPSTCPTPNRQPHGGKALEAKVLEVLRRNQLVNPTMRLVAAKKYSEWYMALLLSDCKSLMRFLKEDETLVRYTGHEGRTVLHAAARRGCVPLVNQIMQIFMRDGQFCVDDIHKRVLLEDLFQAEDAKTKLRAGEIMEYFMGSKVIREFMKDYNSKVNLIRLSSFADVDRDGTEGNPKGNAGEIKDTPHSPQATDPPCSSDNYAKSDIFNATYVYYSVLRRVYKVVQNVGRGDYFKKELSKFRNLFKNTSRGKSGYHGLEMNKATANEKESSPQSPSNSAHGDELKIILRDLIGRLLDTKKFEGLRERYTKDKDYNFDEERKEYVFHYACRIVRSNKCAKSFIQSVVQECSKRESDGDKVLQYLFKLHNWQGNTPCHAALNGFVQGLEILLNLLPKNSLSSSEFINACDARGWTPLHKVVAIMGGNGSWRHRRLFWLLLNDERIEVNKTLHKSNVTPLHLAILHNLPKVVEMLIWKGKDININALVKRKIKHTSTTSRSTSYWWSPLQLAAVMGRADIVKGLLTKIDNIYEVSKRNNKGVAPTNYDDSIPALHLAASSGDPEVLSLFLNIGYKTFDPATITMQKRTSLHCAVDALVPFMVHRQICEADKFINHFLSVLDFGDLYHLEDTIKPFQKNMNITNDIWGWPSIKCQRKTLIGDYARKQTCITMLLQDGANIWQQDDTKKFAEPGPEADVEIQLWWFNLKAEKTLPGKKILNDAANATSVVATLIATASYVGPLQPPLGYGSSDPYFDLVQTTNMPVRIFVVSNCLAFYLAIGSIMFAIVPNISIPHQGVFEEWQRSRRIVGIAISLLLMSVLNILISFAAASNAGMSDYYSWEHVGLAFYPAMLGGVSCIIGSVVFFIDFQRFIQSFGIGMKNDHVVYTEN